MGEYYGNNDWRDYLAHYGVKGMKWRHHKKKELNGALTDIVNTIRGTKPGFNNNVNRTSVMSKYKMKGLRRVLQNKIHPLAVRKKKEIAAGKVAYVRGDARNVGKKVKNTSTSTADRFKGKSMKLKRKKRITWGGEGIKRNGKVTTYSKKEGRYRAMSRRQGKNLVKISREDH